MYCALAEPAKRAVLDWNGRPLPREARCVLYQRPAGQTWVITVSLDDAAVIRKVLVPQVQPPLMAEEWMANTDQIKADPGFRAALLFADPASGRMISETIWRDPRARAAAPSVAAIIRREFPDQAGRDIPGFPDEGGAEIRSVADYRLVFSSIRNP